MNVVQSGPDIYTVNERDAGSHVVAVSVKLFVNGDGTEELLCTCGGAFAYGHKLELPRVCRHIREAIVFRALQRARQKDQAGALKQKLQTTVAIERKAKLDPTTEVPLKAKRKFKTE